jgi:lipopolysaccharide transport system permease protein
MLSATLPFSAINARAELLATLVRRELASRYRGAILGGSWPLVVQLSQLFVFTYLFGVILHTRVAVGTMAPSPVAFGLWIFAGLVSWNAFVNGLMQASGSVVNQPHLVKKVVFPLAILPLVPVCCAVIESLVGILALVAFTATRMPMHFGVLGLIPIIILQMIFTSGLAYIVAAAMVFFRDTVQALNPILLVWFYLSPIVYPEQQIPQSLRWLDQINPIAAFVQGYRDAVFSGPGLGATRFIELTLVSFAVFALGFAAYRHTRTTFADVL